MLNLEPCQFECHCWGEGELTLKRDVSVHGWNWSWIAVFCNTLADLTIKSIIDIPVIINITDHMLVSSQPCYG